MTVLETHNHSCIYCILNKDTGKMYFGYTKNFNKRSKEHVNALKNCQHYNTYLQKAFNKKQILQIFPVESCIIDLLPQREKFWISYHESHKRENGYNLTEGGEDLATQTEESKLKRSEARKGKSGTLKGRPQYASWIQARINATKGQKRFYSQEHLDSIKKARALAKGTRQKGKTVIVTNLTTKEKLTFNSKRLVEDFLSLKRDTLIHKFYKGKPRIILKQCIVNNYLIQR